MGIRYFATQATQELQTMTQTGRACCENAHCSQVGQPGRPDPQEISKKWVEILDALKSACSICKMIHPFSFCRILELSFWQTSHTHYIIYKLNVQLPLDLGLNGKKNQKTGQINKGSTRRPRSELGLVFLIMFVADLVPLNFLQLHVGLWTPMTIGPARNKQKN